MDSSIMNKNFIYTILTNLFEEETTCMLDDIDDAIDNEPIEEANNVQIDDVLV
jgi:hypothetical protein